MYLGRRYVLIVGNGYVSHNSAKGKSDISFSPIAHKKLQNLRLLEKQGKVDIIVWLVDIWIVYHIGVLGSSRFAVTCLPAQII